MAGVVSDEEESSASTRVRDEDMQDVVLGEREDIILPAETLSSNEKEDNTNKIVKVEDDKTHVEATNKQAAASPPVKSDALNLSEKQPQAMLDRLERTDQPQAMLDRLERTDQPQALLDRLERTDQPQAMLERLERTTVILSSDETPKETFERLTKGLQGVNIDKSEAVDSIFNALVGGAFDMETRFIIVDPQNVVRLLELLKNCDSNLQMCCRVGLVSSILELLEESRDLVADLLVQLLSILAHYSITVKETKRYLKSLRAVDSHWPRNALKLVQIMKDLPRRESSDVFFSFPGAPNAGIYLPPLTKFPYQNGWTFAAWIRLDPPNGVTFEKERPYLYCFRTSKGAEYSCHFMGNCLVVSCDKEGKNSGRSALSKCVKAELKPRKWHHVVLSHNYSRWGRSDVSCYIDGHLAETVQLNWPVSASEAWERCCVGTSWPGTDTFSNTSFSGEMAAIYVWAESLSLAQANSLYCLGPAYQSAFKHEAESDLPVGYKKHLFDGHLHSSLLAVYSPKNCHGDLCLLIPPKTSASHFVQIAHAVMKHGVEVITTHSVQSCLQSVGGVQMIIPLFDQLDLPVQDTNHIQIDISSTLLTLISRLLEGSPSFQQQFYHCKGLLLIAHSLQKSSTRHLSLELVGGVTDLAKFFLSVPSGIPLLKQLFDHLLFNPKLWSLAEPAVQLHLYQYLATDFLANSNFPLILRRVPTVIELCHALKNFYYVVHPCPTSSWTPEKRNESLSNQDVIAIRSAILTVINRLIVLTDEEDANRDQEIHALFNIIATVHENDNLYDVLTLLSRLLSEHPAILIPALDRDHGLGVVFSLLSSPSPLIRIPALKILGFFLGRSTLKRKLESVHSYNALSLLADKLLIHTPYLSMAIYNVLFEILTEKMTATFSYHSHVPPNRESRLENAALLKVISQLIAQSEETEELMKVKKTFLIDLITICKDSRENRRTILQMSVWQEWLISLSYIFPTTDAQHEICELVYDMFNILLYHAIRYEYGGWRVWVDTLAIAHSKVSWEKFKAASTSSKTGSSPSSPTSEDVAEVVGNLVDSVLQNVDGTTNTPVKSFEQDERPTPVYRTPDFCWSKVHIRLLKDLLSSIEGVIDEWKQSGEDAALVSDQLNASDNHVLVANTVHIISQLGDSLIMACGGLLPLLASATSPNSELEIVDACGQELPIDAAAELLSRFAALADTFIFSSSISLAELEQEKNMPSGGILRESLRLIATSSVRHILACKEKPEGALLEPRLIGKWKAIELFVKGSLAAKGKEGLHDMEHLLQEIDLQRIKAVVYRDMEETRHAQFLALAVIYLLSVLMVSRYRDILEPPSTPSPFFNSTNNTPTNSSSNGNAEEGSSLRNGSSDEQKIVEKENQESIEGEEKDKKASDVAAIRIPPSLPTKDIDAHKAADLSGLSRMSSGSSSAPPAERRAYLMTKLSSSLDSSAPLLRDIMTDFRSFLQKTLLGTHGQEIMNDSKVLETLRNKQGSVVELVMLLCSQEWQTSLQKHAGLAFIELVNEGRLMAHATRDHVLRVANEADFILNRLRAEDVSKHTQFENETAEQMDKRCEEERRLQRVLSSCRRRDAALAIRAMQSLIGLLTAPSGAWAQDSTHKQTQEFWRLDVWEDDSRRRLRFVPNPYGSRHLEAVQDEGSHQQFKEDEDPETMIRQLAGDVAPSRSAATELVDESDMEKWAAEAEQPVANENTSYSTGAKLIAAGVIVPGTLSITASDLYFDADEEDPLYQAQDPKSLAYCEWLHGRWQLHEIRAIFLRRHLLQNTALELFLASRTAVMLAFESHDKVRAVVEHLPRVGVGVKYGLPQSRKTSLLTPRQLFRHSDMTQRWQKREITNFDYLMFLNTVAGRTFNDLNQYPVFPWILTNYTDKNLDLSVASNFRDLSKPVGALSESRKKFFEERFQSWDDSSIPPFHYGTHYSTAAFTLNWLFRVEPFTTFFLNMQGGKFDWPDRLFFDMADTWERCQRDSHDVKELIPELFYLPEMIRNSNDLPLGMRSDGKPVADVKLPPWANSPEEFIRIHRQALESDLVSCQLNQWIDLIFGYKQRGAEAVRATNVFHYLTYEGAVKLSAIRDPVHAEAIQLQIASFGQTPVQLLTEAHPPRHSVMSISPLMFGRSEDELCMLMKFVSNSGVVYLSANTFSQLPHPTVISISNNLVFALNRWHNSYTGARGGSITISEKDGDSHSVAELPLTVDPLLSSAPPGSPPSKRILGDALDQRLTISSSFFVSTADSRAILSCGYPDYSFRVTDTETGVVRQVIYGHSDVVTCMARSETSLYSDCYVATGSLDCTVALWHWSGQLCRIVGETGGMQAESASPRVILTGHDASITALAVSAEHGLVISGCKDGAVLLHTTTGDLLRRCVLSSPILSLSLSRDCLALALEGKNTLVVFSSSSRVLAKITTPYSIECVTVTRDGEYIVTGSDNGIVALWRLFPLEQLYHYQRAESSIRSLSVTANQRFVLAGLDTGAIIVYNADFVRWHALQSNKAK